MEALSGLFTLLLVWVFASVASWRRPLSNDLAWRYSPDGQRAYARATFREECALCDDDIYIWDGRFLHVLTDSPVAATPHGPMHRPMPWSVYQQLWRDLRRDEDGMLLAFGEPRPVWEKDGQIGLIGKCPGCLKRHRIQVDRAAYMAFRSGTSLIDALNGASTADVAMVEAGWHADCLRNWWGDIRRVELSTDAA